MASRLSDEARLRYLDAERVAGPVGPLAHATLESADGRPLGTVEGVLIDPAARRLRYFVVEVARRFRSRRYLVAADQPATLDAARRALRLLTGIDLQTCREFDRRFVREYSAEDAVEAMFAA